MKTIFPDVITNLQEAIIPFGEAAAFISQSSDHQVVFMEFAKEVEMAEHSHEVQVGFVLKGRIVLTINGDSKV
jgi:quercetin dioxygenase-like cupin family protein